MKNDKWTREQTIVALNLYCKIPFNKVSSTHSDILKYSSLIGRSPNSLKMKIGNFGSFDPELKRRGIVGLQNTSKLDEDIWDEFSNDWERLAYESELLITKFEGKDLANIYEEFDFDDKRGDDKIRSVKTRVNQKFFRQTVLSSYNFSCAITGLNIPELLVASHIIPWKDNKETRVNPKNGICLNVFHDKAFDKGFITITTDYKIKVSNYIYDNFEDNSTHWFKQYENLKINMPERFAPNLEFILYHNENIFESWKKQ
ncbi:MAG: restriction endonuclease [Ignavibacteria bacterium]|nr:restriction endonuclease [Ignavibacteria bacterium]